MKHIDFKDLQGNPEQLIGHQWMLVTAGTPEQFNTMTASWGGLGYLWNRPVAYVFVRPNRHTRSFIEAQPAFTLSFMPEQYRDDLIFCGRHSGREVDKMEQTKLKPLTTENGLVAMQDADLVLECRKMYAAPLLQEAFMDWAEVAPKWYDADNPLHLMYICEISRVLVRA